MSHDIFTLRSSVRIRRSVRPHRFPGAALCSAHPVRSALSSLTLGRAQAAAAPSPRVLERAGI